MTAKRLFVLFLSVAFLLGAAGLAVAQEKIAQEKKIVNPCAANPCAAKAVAKTKTVEGTVKSVSDTSLVIEEKDKQELTLAVSRTVAKSVQKLKPGDTVNVVYTETDGKMMASKVTMAKMREKKAANPCAPKK